MNLFGSLVLHDRSGREVNFPITAGVELIGAALELLQRYNSYLVIRNLMAQITMAALLQRVFCEQNELLPKGARFRRTMCNVPSEIAPAKPSPPPRRRPR